MKARNIGGSDLQCGVLGLGTNRLLDPENIEMVQVANEALDIGINLFDGADMYGDGQCERFLGEVLKPRRSEAVIASKFGMVRRDDGPGFRQDGRPDYVRRACKASLRRLGTSYIDLYYMHQMDPTVPIEETVGAMAELVDTGKVRALGLCNTTPEIIRRAHAVHPLAAVQMEYSLMDRQVEEEILPLCAELGITFVAFGPLTYAFLTGEVRSRDDLPSDDGFRLRQTRFAEDNLQHNYKLLDCVNEVASEAGATPAQVALAWCFHRSFDVLPIPGSSKVTHLRQNAEAAEVHLSDAQVRALDAAFSPNAIKGAGAFAPVEGH